MKKRLFSILLTVVLLISLGATAFAATYDVVYTSAGKLTAPDSSSLTNRIQEMQPGDVVTFSITLQNQNSTVTRWYMSNSITEILEKTSTTNGGAYSYVLSYSGPSTSKEFYNSDRVGGDQTLNGRQGLEEATIDLEDYFFLDTLNSGETGTVNLTVAMEGESQGNSYQDTRGQILLKFAVEPQGSKTVVKTGDENNLTPYYIGMVIAGLLLLYLALDAYTDRKYKKGRAVR